MMFREGWWEHQPNQWRFDLPEGQGTVELIRRHFPGDAHVSWFCVLLADPEGAVEADPDAAFKSLQIALTELSELLNKTSPPVDPEGDTLDG